jgi:transcriptional regulator with XRE-family HTH domain
MKKNNPLDFRRETVDLFKKLNLTNQDVAFKLNVTVTTVSRWRTGAVSPRKKQFDLLKRLASGQLEVVPLYKQQPPSESQKDSIAELRDELKKQEGKMEVWMNQVIQAIKEGGSNKFLEGKVQAALDTNTQQMMLMGENFSTVMQELDKTKSELKVEIKSLENQLKRLANSVQDLQHSDKTSHK